MSIKSRLESVYPGYDLVSYSSLSGSVLSSCPECGEDCVEKMDEYYPDPDSWIECLNCGSRFDFRYEENLWIKKREESIDN